MINNSVGNHWCELVSLRLHEDIWYKHASRSRPVGRIQWMWFQFLCSYYISKIIFFSGHVVSLWSTLKCSIYQTNGSTLQPHHFHSSWNIILTNKKWILLIEYFDIFVTRSSRQMGRHIGNFFSTQSTRNRCGTVHHCQYSFLYFVLFLQKPP